MLYIDSALLNDVHTESDKIAAIEIMLQGPLNVGDKVQLVANATETGCLDDGAVGVLVDDKSEDPDDMEPYRVLGANGKKVRERPIRKSTHPLTHPHPLTPTPRIPAVSHGD